MKDSYIRGAPLSDSESEEDPEPAAEGESEDPPMLSEADIVREHQDRQERAAYKLRIGLQALSPQRQAISDKHSSVPALEAKLIEEWHSAHQSAKRDWVSPTRHCKATPPPSHY